MYLYSCHDSTLTALLLALGCYDDRWPPYAADVAFELYKDVEGRHWVMIRYCGKVTFLLLNLSTISSLLKVVPVNSIC